MELNEVQELIDCGALRIKPIVHRCAGAGCSRIISQTRVRCLACQTALVAQVMERKSA